MWDVVDPIINRWEDNPAQELPNYTAGTWGPEKANDLIEKDGRQWRIR
jgi:glucose-6-phosphate 1-dehydrogenase